MDQGVQKEIDSETKAWNTREWKGTPVDRFPLSPSQIGKCALALARNLSHYLGVADYPRNENSITPRTKRIFARGHLLEAALIEDLEKFAGFKVVDRQKELTLFTLADGRAIRGSIDGVGVYEDGTRILLDFKSKGAFYSGAFQDSISQFFNELRQTGHVQELSANAYIITDPKALFDTISFNDFFIDYLLQLNAYGYVEKTDFVSLYYENKNTCANYEVRWVPHVDLFTYARDKFQYIYDQVHSQGGAESIPKEFSVGSSRCRLCDYNQLCWGKYTPTTTRSTGELGAKLDKALRESRANGGRGNDRIDEEVLQFMQQHDYSHIQTSEGLVYERKFLKSPKPHHELRLSK
jgi:hypothetical protein